MVNNELIIFAYSHIQWKRIGAPLIDNNDSMIFHELNELRISRNRAQHTKTELARDETETTTFFRRLRRRRSLISY